MGFIVVFFPPLLLKNSLILCVPFLKELTHILCVVYSAYMHMYVPCICLVSEGVRKGGIESQNRVMDLYSTMLVLGLEPLPSARAT